MAELTALTLCFPRPARAALAARVYGIPARSRRYQRRTIGGGMAAARGFTTDRRPGRGGAQFRRNHDLTNRDDPTAERDGSRRIGTARATGRVNTSTGRDRIAHQYSPGRPIRRRKRTCRRAARAVSNVGTVTTLTNNGTSAGRWAAPVRTARVS